MHCSVLAEQAIKAALADYYRRNGIDPTPLVGELPRARRPAMSTKRVLVAVSGGVDPSVAVHLLRQQGYEVEGIILEFSPRTRRRSSRPRW